MCTISVDKICEATEEREFIEGIKIVSYNAGTLICNSIVLIVFWISRKIMNYWCSQCSEKVTKLSLIDLTISEDLKSYDLIMGVSSEPLSISTKSL